ncbi:MAG: hypothetical protein AAF512_09880 [Pseudomonadota bacterium]
MKPAKLILRILLVLALLVLFAALTLYTLSPAPPNRGSDAAQARQSLSAQFSPTAFFNPQRDGFEITWLNVNPLCENTN